MVPATVLPGRASRTQLASFVFARVTAFRRWRRSIDVGKVHEGSGCAVIPHT